MIVILVSLAHQLMFCHLCSCFKFIIGVACKLYAVMFRSCQYFVQFLRKMAQPYDKTGGGGRKTLLSQQDLEKMLVDGNINDFLY